MKKCIIVDIDGTIADGRWRHHLLPTKENQNKTLGWEVFNKAGMGDAPIPNVIHDVIKNVSRLDCDIIYLTGRGASAEPETRLWLNIFAPQGELIMRPMDDHRKAADFKLETVMGLMVDWEVAEAYEDDPTIVQDVFRTLGISVTHVEDFGAKLTFYQGEEAYRE